MPWEEIWCTYTWFYIEPYGDPVNVLGSTLYHIMWMLIYGTGAVMSYSVIMINSPLTFKWTLKLKQIVVRRRKSKDILGKMLHLQKLLKHYFTLHFPLWCIFPRSRILHKYCIIIMPTYKYCTSAERWE